MNGQVSLIGVPTNSAGKRGGVANAPAILRRAGLVQALGRHCQVRDEGDVEFQKPMTSKRDADSGIIASSSLASMIRSVRENVRNALQEGRFPLVVGGDCPILLGCLAASVDMYNSARLLFVDGHEDAYLPRQSPTGEAADMELGLALGLEVPSLVRNAIGSVPLIDASDVCMLGPRDKTILQKTGVKSLDGRIEYYDDAALSKGEIEAIARTPQAGSKGRETVAACGLGRAVYQVSARRGLPPAGRTELEPSGEAYPRHHVF